VANQRFAAKVIERRAQLKELAAARVRRWAFGTEVNFPGDPRRRIRIHPTSTAPVRLVQFSPSDGEAVTVGPYTGIHHTVTIIHGGLHRMDWVGVLHTRPLGDGQWSSIDHVVTSKGPVVVGGDVWVGYEALIMSGVTIGDGAVVAARAVITKDVEPYEIVGGNPAKHIRWRFDEQTRAALLRIRWWDWPTEKVERLRHEIDSPDVAGFIRRHDPARQGGG
jgi:acetyltransferase-like isoleucine patch superfamily enzyme